MPNLPEFVQRRREGAGSESVEEEVSQGNFRFCLVKFIELLMDFSAGQPSHLEFRYYIPGYCSVYITNVIAESRITGVIK